MATVAAEFAITFPIVEYEIKTGDGERAVALRSLVRDATWMAGFMHAYCHPYRNDPLRIYEVHANDLPNMRELNLMLGSLLGAISEIAQRDSGSFIADYTETLSPEHKRLLQARLTVHS
jgi:hypothetical protein